MSVFVFFRYYNKTEIASLFFLSLCCKNLWEFKQKKSSQLSFLFYFFLFFNSIGLAVVTTFHVCAYIFKKKTKTLFLFVSVATTSKIIFFSCFTSGHMVSKKNIYI